MTAQTSQDWISDLTSQYGPIVASIVEATFTEDEYREFGAQKLDKYLSVVQECEYFSSEGENVDLLISKFYCYLYCTALQEFQDRNEELFRMMEEVQEPGQSCLEKLVSLIRKLKAAGIPESGGVTGVRFNHELILALTRDLCWELEQNDPGSSGSGSEGRKLEELLQPGANEGDSLFRHMKRTILINYPLVKESERLCLETGDIIPAESIGYSCFNSALMGVVSFSLGSSLKYIFESLGVKHMDFTKIKRALQQLSRPGIEVLSLESLELVGGGRKKLRDFSRRISADEGNPLFYLLQRVIEPRTSNRVTVTVNSEFTGMLDWEIGIPEPKPESENSASKMVQVSNSASGGISEEEDQSSPPEDEGQVPENLDFPDCTTTADNSQKDDLLQRVLQLESRLQAQEKIIVLQDEQHQELARESRKLQKKVENLGRTTKKSNCKAKSQTRSPPVQDVKITSTRLVSNLLFSVWKKYFTGVEEQCPICNAEISIINWCAGLVISRANGGKRNMENLIPICSECNAAIGDSNMDDWISENYPQRYSAVFRGTRWEYQ